MTTNRSYTLGRPLRDGRILSTQNASHMKRANRPAGPTVDLGFYWPEFVEILCRQNCETTE